MFLQFNKRSIKSPIFSQLIKQRINFFYSQLLTSKSDNIEFSIQQILYQYMFKDTATEKLNQLGAKSSPIKFELEGTSNWVQFQYREQGNRRSGAMYLEVLVDADGLKFDACVVQLDGLDPSKVQRIPLIIEGCTGLIGQRKGKGVEKIQSIKLSIKCSSFSNPTRFISIFLSVRYKQSESSQDWIIVAKVDEWKDLLSSHSQLIGYKLQTLQEQIKNFCWHPKAPCTLQVLLGCQLVEIWDFSETISLKRPAQVINIKKLQKYFAFQKQTQFSNFYVPAAICSSTHILEKDPMNDYSIFLTTKTGQTVSIFPYLPAGAVITQRQFASIKMLSQNSHSHMKLAQYLESCSFTQWSEETREQFETARKFMVKESPCYYDDLNKFALWEFVSWAEDKSQPEQNLLNPGSKAPKYEQTDFLLIPLSLSSILGVSCQYNTKMNTSRVCLSLLPQQQSSESSVQTKLIFSLAELQTEIEGPANILAYTRSEQSSNCLIFLFQKNHLFKIDYSAATLFARTNEICHLAKQNAFPISTLLQLNTKIQIKTLFINVKHLKLYCYFKQKSRDSLFFQYFSLANYFDRTNQLVQNTKDMITSIKKARKNPLKRQIHPRNHQIQSFGINKQKAKNYLLEKNGWNQYKTDVQNFCNSIRNDFEGDFNSECRKMSEKYKEMSQLIIKKERLARLITKMKSNKVKINELLKEEKKSQTSPQVRVYFEQCLNITQMIQGSSKVSAENDEKIRETLVAGLSSISEKLNKIKLMLEKDKMARNL